MGKLAQLDPQLGHVFERVYPFLVSNHEKTGETATYADIDEAVKPDDAVKIPMARVKATGERIPYVDDNGNPLPKSLLIIRAAKSRYRPSPKNKRSNPNVYSKLRALELRLNEVSGIVRAGAEPLPESAVAELEALDMDAIG